MKDIVLFVAVHAATDEVHAPRTAAVVEKLGTRPTTVVVLEICSACLLELSI